METDLIMEIKGCLTQYEPLTPELLEALARDGLTYAELVEHMEKAGLAVEKIVCDPTRKLQNAYYADYENGRYCEIYLQRSYLDALLKIATTNFSKTGKSQNLEEKNWDRFYFRDVPMPMLIYDFQRRYLDIEADQIFDVWLHIHTRIDYANGQWKDETLKYVFDHAPKPVLPELDPSGEITIYRGMGEKSQPPEKAISWTTDPTNALWFANRSGRGTALLVASVRPDQIVAYLPGFRHENEVILRPGTVTAYSVEDMIPATEDYVPAMLMPATADFIQYTRIAKTLGYQTENPFMYHGLPHIFRVLLLSLIYFYNSGDSLTDADKQILIYFSLLHDLGRDSDSVDDRHGEKSLDLIKQRGIRIKGIRLSQKEYRMANLLIAYHCRDDEVGIAAIQAEPTFSARDKARTQKLYRIAKDMDGLDRVRFNGLDYRMLRTEYGRRLPLVAGCLLKEALLDQLCTQDWDESVSKLTGQEQAMK